MIRNPCHTGPTKHLTSDSGFAIIISWGWIGTLMLKCKGSVIHTEPQEPVSFSILISRFWNFSVHQNYLGGLFEMQVSGPYLTLAKSKSLGVGPMSTPIRRTPGVCDAGGLWTTLWRSLVMASCRVVRTHNGRSVSLVVGRVGRVQALTSGPGIM